MPAPISGSPSAPRPSATSATDTTPGATPAAGGTLPSPGGPVDAFGSGTGRPALSLGGAGTPPPLSPLAAGIQDALDHYTSNLEEALNYDAMSLARGERPVRDGEVLSGPQLDEVKDATRDFLLELPLGAYAPALGGELAGALRARGHTVGDLSATRLKDFDDVGRDLAKQLVGRLRPENPAALYALATGLAAAAGVAAWTGGSDRLKQLGIRPQASVGFFDDRLKVRVGAEFDAHFRNLRGTATVSGNLPLGDGGRLTGSATFDSRNGFDSARVGYDLNRPNLDLSAGARFDRAGLATADASVTYRPNPDLRLSGTVSHDFRTDVTTATGEAAWRVNRNTDFALSGSHDSSGDSRVGVGVRIHF